MRTRRAAIRVALPLAAVLLTLLLLEVALRGFYAAKSYLTQPGAGQPPPVPLHVVTDSPVLYALNPEHPDISAQGTRDEEAAVPKPEGRFRILVLGDSVAYGSAVPRGDTFPNRIERMLRGRAGGADVVNAGVMGYTPYNELQYYLTRGREFGADVVVVAFCMNDIANPRLHWGDAPGVEIPGEAIPNPDYDREHILPRVRELKEKQAQAPEQRGPPLPKHSELYAAVEGGLKRLFRKKARNFADTGSGVQTYVTGEDTLSIEVLLDRGSPEWRWLAAQYDRLHEAVRAERATLVIAIFPLAYQLDEGYPFLPQLQLAEYCRERSIHCLDLLPSFRRRRKEDIFLLDKEGHDDIWHLTDYGHALTAEELMRFLREKGLLPADVTVPSGDGE